MSRYKNFFQTIIWYFFNLKYLPEFYDLIKHILCYKFNLNNYRIKFDDSKKKSMTWSQKNSQTLSFVLENLFFNSQVENFYDLKKKQISILLKDFNSMKPKLGGAGDLDLLYNIIINHKPKNIAELGVAYGWSTYAILEGINKNKNNSNFNSFDMPYPYLGSSKNIARAIKLTDVNSARWNLYVCSNRLALKIIKEKKLKLDLIFYDSEKKYNNKLSSLKQLWKHLDTKTGIMIVDDINDNLAFHDFVNYYNIDFFIIKTKNNNNDKFTGIVSKFR